MAVHIFVDESKARGYLFAATSVLTQDVVSARKRMVQLRLRGQHRIHFSKEDPRRRRLLIGSIRAIPATTVIYDASAIRNHKQARTACIEALIADAAVQGAREVILEEDDSLITEDQHDLFQQVQKVGCLGRLRYAHMKPRAEPLLWIPDAVAWCWAKGGDWRQRIRPAVSSVSELHR